MQRKTLNEWFNTARWTYNQAVAAIREGTQVNKQALREVCVKQTLFKEQNQWVLRTPSQIRDNAMLDVEKAYKSNFAAKRSKFTVQFKSRKNPSDSILINARDWKDGVIYRQRFGKQPLKAREKLPKTLDYGTRIQRTRLGEFYLCLPQPLHMRSENQAPVPKVVALDPGVRTFQMAFTSDNEVLALGDGDIGRIASMCKRLDELQSRWSKPDVRHKQRYQMKRAGMRMRKKIQNLVRDCHHKIAKYLCENFTTILIPTFESKHMVSRIKRRISSKTARMILTWSHYTFRQRLKDKSEQYPWCEIIEVTEEYTSKTCTRCGVLNEKLGHSKFFSCDKCGLQCDRDANGARNILLKFLTEHQRAEEIRRWVLAPSQEMQG